MTETFTCASCGETLPKGWTDAEVNAEAQELFPGINTDDPDEAGMVCDACYQYLMGRMHAEAPELIGEGWRGLQEDVRCYQTPSGAPVHVMPGCMCKG